MKDEKEMTGDQTLVWWDEKWASKDKMWRSHQGLIQPEDMNFWIHKVLEKGVETRIWYLRTGMATRIKSLILRDEDWDDLMYLGKCIGTIRQELGECQGSRIIQEAVYEAEIELAKNGLSKDDIKAKLEKLLKQMADMLDTFAPFSNKVEFIRSLILDSVDIQIVKKVYLFGSYAYGVPTPDSDIDLCVVIDDEHDHTDAYIEISTKLFDNDITPCDLLVYNERYFYGSENPDGIENTIMKKGILLYG